MQSIMRRVAPAAPARPARALVCTVQAVREQGTSKKVLKRAPSAFNLFVKAKFKDVQAQLSKNGSKPGLPECSAQLRDMWAKLSESDKAPFADQAAEAKAELAVAR